MSSSVETLDPDLEAALSWQKENRSERMASFPVATATLVAAVCTRGRGDAIVPTLRTILANTHPAFAVVVIDQNDDAQTETAVSSFRADPRLIYHRVASRGLGAARNDALRITARLCPEARVVAFTDDDCTVPPNWLDVVDDAFARNPRVAVLFCNVAAAPYDQNEGFIPAYERDRDLLVTNLWGKCRARGIGAGLAIRVAAMETLGGFDDQLGAGARFPSCEDGDIAVRALLGGFQVLETSRVAVTHFGFRTWAQGKGMAQRDWAGIGAAYFKPLRAGRIQILPVLLYEFFVRALFPPFRLALLLRRPSGITRVTAFLAGIREAAACPIDRRTLRYVPNGKGKPE